MRSSGQIGFIPLSFAIFLALILARSLWPSEVVEEVVSKGLKAYDMTGRTVVLPAPPQRIMPLTPVTWHYLTLEKEPRFFLMVPPYMLREIKLSPLKWVFPSLVEKPVAFLNNQSVAPFSVEQTLSQNPDAVLAWDYLSADFERAKVKGLIKISADSGEKEKLYKLLGEITDKQKRVDLLFEILDEKKEEIFNDITENIRTKGILIIDDDNFSLGTRKFYKRFNYNAKQISIINEGEKIGTKNGLLNIEALLLMDPEIILINHYLLQFSTLNVEDIYRDERLVGLRAVQNRRVYHMPKGAARLEGPLEEHLLTLWLFQVIHFDEPSGLNLRDEIKQSYKLVYDYDLSDDQVDEWLRLKENLQSKGYEKFIRPLAVN